MYRMHILYMTFIFYTSIIFAQENGQGIELESGRQFVQRSSQGSHQENKSKEFLFSGQLSTWGQFTPDIPTKTWMGGRYIPQLNFNIPLKNDQLFDIEASANLFGDIGIRSGNVSTDGKIKPYRAWARYSSTRMEARIGLQKINFGSAQMFRPLMWFDSMDPRDPLQLTDGVWAGLFRYYFPNNSTLWLWSLYGNNERKGWEIVPVTKSFPELGGRIQLPVPKGEGAFSYHFRKTDMEMGTFGLKEISENRFGFDLRLDVTVGFWLESSWTHLNASAGELINQQMATLGTDYTFDIGNGLTTTFEQFFYAYSQKRINPHNSLHFSGLHTSYPITLLDNLSAMVYYNWKEQNFYNFLDWQHQLNNITIHTIAYWNPQQIGIPSQMGTSQRFAGKGLQLMVIWHH